MNNLIEERILNMFIGNLKDKIKVPVDISIERKENLATEENRHDILLKMTINNQIIYICAEVIKTINKANIGMLLKKKKEVPYKLILLTEYVNINLGEELKRNDIQYMDTIGNMYINTNNVYIDIIGNKPAERLQKGRVKRAFMPSGLKMIFAVLQDNTLLDKPYREIAKIAGVALGTVGWVMRDLMELGYLIKMGNRGIKLRNMKELIDRWCVEYPETLKPKLLIGKFDGPIELWNNIQLDPNIAQWGGEVAANKLTNYLKPHKLLIYANRENYEKVIVENRFKKNDLNGIEIYERFWDLQYYDVYKDIVPPMLVYADLIGTGEQRNIETARIIYEKYIIKHIRKDR